MYGSKRCVEVKTAMRTRIDLSSVATLMRADCQLNPISLAHILVCLTSAGRSDQTFIYAYNVGLLNFREDIGPTSRSELTYKS